MESLEKDMEKLWKVSIYNFKSSFETWFFHFIYRIWDVRIHPSFLIGVFFFFDLSINRLTLVKFRIRRNRRLTGSLPNGGRSADVSRSSRAERTDVRPCVTWPKKACCALPGLWIFGWLPPVCKKYTMLVSIIRRKSRCTVDIESEVQYFERRHFVKEKFDVSLWRRDLLN